jgi:hypothetical protein
MRTINCAVLVGALLASGISRAQAQRPAVVFRDTLSLAPARVALTGFAGWGVLVELVGSDPRQATFMSDSTGRAWTARTFDMLSAVADGSPAGRAPWSSELDRYAGGRPQGLLLGYVDVEGRRGEAELALTMYRRVYDVATVIPVQPAEAQRVLGRLGAAFEAVRAAAPAASGCSEVPALAQPALMPDVETRRKYLNGELLLAFTIGENGRAEPSSIEVLYASDRAFETSTRRFIERTTYQPARGHHGPCRAMVVQDFEFNVEPPTATASSRRTRIGRLR